MTEKHLQSTIGRLSLVSVGIGDMENITFRAMKAIEDADVIFAMKFIKKQFKDILKGKEVHEAGHARFIDTAPTYGHKPASSSQEQETIRIIREAISDGKRVAILDFGDPTLYSPQTGYLNEFADLSPDVIPGVSSIAAANAVLKKELSGQFDRPIAITHAMEGKILDERLDMLAASGQP